MTSIVIKANHLLRDYSDQGTELTLPADKVAILDALDRARVPYGSGEYRLLPDRKAPAFLKKLLDKKSPSPSIEEMNHLAKRLENMESYEMDKLEGVLQIRGTYGITDVINATHNLNRFVQHPVYDDAELGEIAIDSGGMYEPLEQVPDELLSCLNPEKVGALVRKQDGGVFTDNGYVVRENEGWDEVYDGKTLAGRAVTLGPGDPVIRLLLSLDEFSCDEHESEWLLCPAKQEDIDVILTKLDTKSLNDLHIIEVNCAVPALAETVLCSLDIDEVNELASVIKDRCGADFVKYKAVCEMENVRDIAAAINLTTRLDEYDFEPYPSTAAFGRAMLEKTGADVKLAEEYGFDFNSYGWKVMDEQKIRSMPYGFVSHPRGQEQTMEIEMAEPEIPFEQSMNI